MFVMLLLVFNNSFIVMGGMLYNVQPYTKYNFPITLTGLFGISGQVAIEEGSYFIEGLNGWDGAGFWIAAKSLSGGTLSPLGFVTWIAVGYI